MIEYLVKTVCAECMKLGCNFYWCRDCSKTLCDECRKRHADLLQTETRNEAS